MEFYRNVNDVIDKIKEARTIGIDGVDHTGKTPLSEEIGRILNVSVLNLDNYLDRNLLTYVKNLKYAEIEDFIKKHQESFVIEGVCLLDILKRLNIKVDYFIYVKRIDSYGNWFDEDVCDIRDSAEETIERIERGIRILNPEFQELTPFRKELINYHEHNRPFEKADIILERIIND